MRAKLINEGVGDLLKPKTAAEIESDLNKLSGNELYDLYNDTRDITFLVRALKVGGANIYKEDIAQLLEDDPSLENYLFPYVVKQFPFELEKTKSGYNLLISWWDEFTNCFHENREIDIDVVSSILEGDAFEIFENFDNNVDLTDIYLNFSDSSINFNDLINEIKEKIIEEKSDAEIQGIDDINKLINYIGENEDEMPLISEAIKMGINEVQSIADESEAFNDLTNEIKNHFGWKFEKLDKIGKNNLFKIPVSKKNIIELFKIHNDVGDKINYYPPSYGWSGDIDKHPDVFYESIQNRISEI